MVQVRTLLDQIDMGAVALPEFQRGYVWNREQVRGFMRSLYRRYPVGSLLVWQTRSEEATVRGERGPAPGVVKLLLDGQQRATTLYGIINGEPPTFFDGDRRTFEGLHFHIEDEVFEFYRPTKMQGDPRWIDVGGLFKEGLGPWMAQVWQLDDINDDVKQEYLQRLNRLQGIRDIDFHVEEVTGGDKAVDEVVEVFNQLNSGGTKLSKGDLALARVCAEWPEARHRMRELLAIWSQAGFEFKLDWLLRITTAVQTGEARFEALRGVDVTDFERALKNGETAVNYLLNLISSRLGLDHDRVLAGRYAFPVMARHLINWGGSLKTASEQGRLLYWYVHEFLWQRYVGASESNLNQDLDTVDQEGVAGLIRTLQDVRGDLTVRPTDFAGYSVGARFYPLLYMLTRVGESRDLGNGVPLKAHLLGRSSSLQVHHLFPKALLYEHGYSRAQVNAIANFCFLTRDTNIRIGKRSPFEYFEEVEEHQLGALASQWVPMDRELWSLDRYPDFLQARRELLADAANGFLGGLLEPTRQERPADEVVSRAPLGLQGAPEQEVEDREELGKVVAWLRSQGFASPEWDAEIQLGRQDTAILDVAWERGLQPELSEPVGVSIEPTAAVEVALAEKGWRLFSTPEALRAYAINELGATRNSGEDADDA